MDSNLWPIRSLMPHQKFIMPVLVPSSVAQSCYALHFWYNVSWYSKLYGIIMVHWEQKALLHAVGKQAVQILCNQLSFCFISVCYTVKFQV